MVKPGKRSWMSLHIAASKSTINGLSLMFLGSRWSMVLSTYRKKWEIKILNNYTMTFRKLLVWICTTVLLIIMTVNHNVLPHNNRASSCWTLNKMPKALDSCDPHFLQRNWSLKAASRVCSKLGMSHPWTMSGPQLKEEVGHQCSGDDVYATAKRWNWWSV